GKMVASASRYGLWLFGADGKLVKRIVEPGAVFSRLAFSPDSKRLAYACTVPGAGGEPKQLVRALEVPAAAKTREGEAPDPQWLGWMPDGEPVAVFLGKREVRFRELFSGKERRFEVADLQQPTFGHTTW